MAVVDEVEEDVGGVVAVGEVSDLVDDEVVGAEEAVEGVADGALAGGVGEAFDEVCGGGEEHVEAVLDGAEGDGEAGLAATGLAEEDDVATLGDEVGREERADGVRRRVDWKAQANSSMVRVKGNWAARVASCWVPRRWAISSEARTKRTCR